MTISSYLPSVEPGLSHLRARLGLAVPAHELSIYTAHTSLAWLAGMTDVLASASALKIRAGLDLAPNQASVDTLTALAASPGRDVEVLRHTNGTFFHPKVYVARHGDRVRAVIGSSNGSSHGFGRSLEANVAIDGSQRSPEGTLVGTIMSQLDDEISARLADGLLTRWRLPLEQPPSIVNVPIPRNRPSPGPTRSDEVQTDGWATDPGFAHATYVCDFYSPLSGVVRYITANEHQGGFDIPSDQMSAVESLIPQGIGAELELAWRFLDQAGETVFRVNEGPRQVKQSGYRGNNRVITAGKRLVSGPLYEELERRGITTGYAHVLYKLQARPSQPPVLWMIHTLPAAAGAAPEDI